MEASFALFAKGERALRTREPEAFPNRPSCQRRPAADIVYCCNLSRLGGDLIMEASFALFAKGERALRTREPEAFPNRTSCQRRPAADEHISFL